MQNTQLRPHTITNEKPRTVREEIESETAMVTVLAEEMTGTDRAKTADGTTVIETADETTHEKTTEIAEEMMAVSTGETEIETTTAGNLTLNPSHNQSLTATDHLSRNRHMETDLIDHHVEAEAMATVDQGPEEAMASHAVEADTVWAVEVTEEGTADRIATILIITTSTIEIGGMATAQRKKCQPPNELPDQDTNTTQQKNYPTTKDPHGPDTSMAAQKRYQHPPSTTTGT